MKKFLTIITLATMMALLSACDLFGGGGGGGGDLVIDDSRPDLKSYQLFPANTFTAGNTTTMHLSGTDTAGGVWTATVTEITQPETTFLGMPAIPVYRQIQLANAANGAFVSSLDAQYYSPDAADRHFYGTDGTTTTVTATTSAIPATAKFGDSGVVGTYTDNAGIDTNVSWRLGASNYSSPVGQAADLVVESHTSGPDSFSSTITTSIDINGKVIHYNEVTYFSANGETITLDSIN